MRVRHNGITILVSGKTLGGEREIIPGNPSGNKFYDRGLVRQYGPGFFDNPWMTTSELKLNRNCMEHQIRIARWAWKIKLIDSDRCRPAVGPYHM